MRRLIGWTLVFAAASPALAGESCHPIDGIEPLLRPGNVVLLGEIHGTVESPGFALEVACHAARKNLDVIVGLELSPRDQSRVDAFLDSEGTDEDRRALLAGAQWQASYQDGRASRAMVDLIDGLRRLRREDLSVRVAMFDAPPTRGGQQRERDMARNLVSAIAAAPRSMTIVLTGNQHSRTTRGTPRNSAYEPMGYLLGREPSLDDPIALNVAHGDGSAWICAPDCGVVELSGHHGEGEWSVEIDDATRPAGHRGWYHVGSITASLPARFPRSEEAATAGVSTQAARPKSVGASRKESRPVEPKRPPAAAELRLDGNWQAYDFGSRHKTWAFRIEGGRFRAQGGEDDWYEGRIAMREEEAPAEIDFAIEDCRCSYKGMTSEAIYRWEDDTLVISAPRPGSARPLRFVEDSGRMMRLVRSTAD